MNQKPSLEQLVIISLELLLALPLGLVLARLGIGGIAWIFGGIVSGAVVFRACRFYHYVPKPNRTARMVGQALVGLAIGFSIAGGNLADVASELPIFALLTFFILLSGTFIGYVYARVSQTNLLTAMLAAVPGSVGIMSSLAADYGKDVSRVALVQIIRLTSVIVLIPIVARVVAGDRVPRGSVSTQNGFSFAPSDLALLALVLLLTVVAIHLASRLQIPAAAFFGSLVVGAAFNPLLSWLLATPDLEFAPPLVINLLGQVLLGITIGEFWINKPNLGKRAVGYALIPVVMTIGAGFIAAAIALLLTPWDWLTCMLVTAPGGAPEIILVALALQHNVEIVTAGHLVRLIAINSSLPIWVFLFRYLDRRLPSSNND